MCLKCGRGLLKNQIIFKMKNFSIITVCKNAENEIEINTDKKVESSDLYENYEPIKDEKQIDSSNFGNGW